MCLEPGKTAQMCRYWLFGENTGDIKTWKKAEQWRKENHGELAKETRTA
jgi:hypothetical protein